MSVPMRSERRTVTALFVDLSNFTSLGARLDPEDLTMLVRECFGELVNEIRTKDGWLEKHIGDALVAFFGAPVAHEDDETRAVSTALAIRERVAAMSERVRDRVGAPLDVHVGINTGLAVVAPALDHGTGDEFMVLGDSVNVAARLQQAADPGQILVGEATYRATGSVYEYRRLPPLKLKGKEERVDAWECLGPLAGAGRRRSPLVGRAQERAALVDRLEALAAGSGGVVIVRGEPGLGKTRLLDDVRTEADRRGVTWLAAGIVSFGENVPYAPFVAKLRELARIEPADSDIEAWQKLGQVASEEELPYLGRILGLDVPDALAPSVQFLDGKGMALQIFRTTRRLVARLARRSPLALVFEDWHWADDSSAALLEHVLPLVGSVPLLVVCTTRSQLGPAAGLQRRAGELALGERLLEIDLEPLTQVESEQLVATLADRALTPRRREQIVAAAERNPFFIEEVVRSLAGTDGGGEQLEIPSTLRGAIMASFDRLSDEPREVLRTAAVLGRTFAQTLLAELVEEPDVERAVRELERVGIVHEVAPAPGRVLAFKHALTHEVVYDSILIAQRRTLHRRVAELLEMEFADDLDELAGTLAFHYAEAQDWKRAQAFLFRAGDQAEAVAAGAEALDYYAKAVDAYTRAFGESRDPGAGVELNRKIGEAFFRRGDHGRAEEYLERALAQLGFAYPATQRGLQLAIAREAARQLVHRLAPLPRYRRIRDEPDRWMDDVSRVIDTLGWIYFFSRPERVVVDSFRELNVGEIRGFRLAIVRGLTGLGFVFDAIPLRRLAGRYHRRAVALGARLENRRSAGIAYLGLAHHQRYQLAAFAEARENFARAAEECRSAGDIRAWMGATLTLAEITCITGDLHASLGHGDQLLEVGEEAGDNQVCGWAHHALGRTLRHAGRVDEAAAHLEQGAALSGAVPDHQAFVVARGNLALCLVEAGDLERALALLDETSRVVEVGRLTTFKTEFLVASATALLAAADGGEDPARLRQVREACRAVQRQARLDRSAAPAALRVRGTSAWLAGKRGEAERLWHKSAAVAAALGLPYETALTEREARRRLT